MDKQTLVRDLRTAAGGKTDFMPIKGIAEYTGMGREAVRALMHGVPYYPNGRFKLYHVRDIANKLSEKMTT